MCTYNRLTTVRPLFDYVAAVTDVAVDMIAVVPRMRARAADVAADVPKSRCVARAQRVRK
jgi:hypothetical protein